MGSEDSLNPETIQVTQPWGSYPQQFFRNLAATYVQSETPEIGTLTFQWNGLPLSIEDITLFKMTLTDSEGLPFTIDMPFTADGQESTELNLVVQGIAPGPAQVTVRGGGPMFWIVAVAPLVVLT